MNLFVFWLTAVTYEMFTRGAGLIDAVNLFLKFSIPHDDSSEMLYKFCDTQRK